MSIEVSEIIKEVAQNQEYRYACKTISNNHELQSDLHSEMLLVLLEYKPQTLIEIYSRGELRWFIVGILTKMWHSTSSPFYLKFRKPLPSVKISSEEYDVEKDNAMQQAVDGVNELLKERMQSGERGEKYEALLFQEYLKAGSVRKLSKKTRIPTMTISDSVRRTKLIIAEKIKLTTPL